MKYLIFFLFSFALIACNKSIKQESFYENGNVKEIKTYVDKKDTTVYSITKYYLNGQMSEKGFIKDGYKDGEWKYWYSDGDIRWTGIFSQGVHVNPADKIPIILFQKDTLYVGEKIYIRIQSSTPIEDLVIGCSNGIIQQADNIELYDCMIIPAQKGILNLYFFDRRSGTDTKKQTFMVY
jgi:Uncharacterized protein conserved in bacteria